MVKLSNSTNKITSILLVFVMAFTMLIPTSPVFAEGTSTHTEDFNGSSIDSNWSVIRQNDAHMKLNNGFLMIDLQNQDIVYGGNNTENILLWTPTSADWTAKTKMVVNFDASTGHKTSGLVVYKDDDNFLRFIESSGYAISFDNEVNGSLTYTPASILGTSTAYMKITKVGNTYTAYFSTDDITYTELNNYTVDLGEDVKIGLLATNGPYDLAEGAALPTTDFDWFDIAYDSVSTPEPTTVRIDETSHPYAGGTWRDNVNNPSFFKFEGFWWSDSWNWMYENASNLNDSVEFKFSGESISLYMTQWSYGGIVDIYLDGNKDATIDTNNNNPDVTIDSANVYHKDNLSPGEHTLKVVTVGNSTGHEAFNVIKAFEYKPATVTQPVKTLIDANSNPYAGGAWISNVNCPSFFQFSGGWWSDGWNWMYNNAANLNESVAFTFTGNSIALYMTQWSYGGIVDIYIDDVKDVTIDTNNSNPDKTIDSAKVFQKDNMDLGEHTIKVVIIGNSTGHEAYVVIKGFEYSSSNSQWSAPGIKVASLPSKTEYPLGENLDISGLEVLYYDGVNTPSVIEVTSQMLSGFDTETVGQKTVIITYNSYTAKFLVKVIVPPIPFGSINLSETYASLITASSTEEGYDTLNVVNGVFEGYKGSESSTREDFNAEWSSKGEKAGAWIKLNFDYPVTINQILLFDRMYIENAIYTGTLSFSDGSSETVSFPTLTPNPKTPALITLSTPKTGIEWVKFTVDTCNENADAVGLAEFKVFGPDVDFMFKPENSDVEVQAGQQLTISILRNDEAKNFSGTYDLEMPAGWTVVSGKDFTADSVKDSIVVSVPDDYVLSHDVINITAKSSTGEQYGYSMIVRTRNTGYSVIDKLITVASPDYYSEVNNSEIEIIFYAPGLTSATARSLHAPDSTDGNPYGYMKTVTENINLDTNNLGRGSFTFNASDFPRGPVSIHIAAWNNNGETDDCYLQLFNYAGVEWDGGPGNNAGKTPSAITEHGFDMVNIFTDEFTELPTISYTGVGEDVKYAAAKPDTRNWPEFSDAKFAPPGYTYGNVINNYSPFSIVDNDYLKIENKEWGQVIEGQWNYQTQTTGCLASMGTDGSGFITKPGAAQYIETRFFIPPNPGLWPSLWTLTPDDPNGRPGWDELDALEADMGGKPTTITQNHHTWGDGYGGIHAGSVASTDDFGNGANLAEGWHTYGVLVTEDTTFYYFDDIYIDGSSHPTLNRSWTVGNYFLINNCFRTNVADRFPGGFLRYGNTAQMYVDYVKAYQVQNEDFTPMFSKVDVTPGQTINIDILRDDTVKNLSGTYNLELPEGWTVISGIDFESGNTQDTISLQIPDDFDVFQSEIKITPVSGNTSYETKIVKSTTNGLYSTMIYPSLNAKGEGYEINFKFDNLSSNTLNNIAITAKGLDDSVQLKVIPTVEPYSSGIATFSVPVLDLYNTANYTFEIKLTEDYTVIIERPISGLIATKAQTPITIDGIIHSDEWAGTDTIVLNKQSQTAGTWNGTDDLSAIGKMKWDDNYLYLAIEVKDDIYDMKESNLSNAWYRDSLQIDLDPARIVGPVIGGPHLGFTAALNSETGESGIVVNQSDYPELGLAAGQLLTRSKCVVTRDESTKTTTYTLAFAREDILPTDYADVTNIGIALVINDSDGLGRKGWIRYMDGIATGKDPMKYGDLILMSNIPTADTTAPSAPEDLACSAKTKHSVTITWKDSVDNVGVKGYEVYKNGVLQQTVTTTYAAITGLDPDTSYEFNVKAVDAAGNVSIGSSITIRTDAVVVDPYIPPTETPTPTTTPAPTVKPGSVEMTAPKSDNNGVARVQVSADIIAKALEGLSDYNNQTLTLTVTETAAAKAVNVQIPASSINPAIAAGIKNVSINTGVANITMDINKLENLSKGASNVSVEAAKVDKSELPWQVTDKIGNSPVFDFNVYADERKIEKPKFRDEVSITIDYTLLPGGNADNVVVYFINDESKLEVVKDCKYDPVTKKVTFKPKHFSKYVALVEIVEFNDLSEVKWAKTSIEALAARGIITSNADDNFVPTKNITRAELVKLLIDAIDALDETAECSFKDVEAISEYYKYIATAQKLGITAGYGDNTFRADREITREEAMIMMYKATKALNIELTKVTDKIDYRDKTQIAKGAIDPIDAFTQANIVSGVGEDKFAPKEKFTKAQAAKVIYDIYKLKLK